MKKENDTPDVQEAPKSDRKSPGFWFYPADYERDVQILSLSSQGLWTRMLCCMSENEMHRGFLELPTGEPMGIEDIAARVGKSKREVEKSLVEMARIGIYSLDERKCYYCRRMARDTHISTVRRAAAKSRMETSKRAADGSFAGVFAGANVPAKEEQNPTVTVSVSVSDSVLLTHTQARVMPRASDLNGATSQRFGEFWELYPRKQHKDAACMEWCSVVVVDSEAAVFACLSRYLASDEVARGAVANPEKWLMEQHRDGWAGDWPKVRAVPTARKSNAERMLDEAAEILRAEEL